MKIITILNVATMFIILFSAITVSANSKSISTLLNENLTTSESSFDGYTLVAPEFSKNTYLIDNSGEIVHTWRSKSRQGMGVYLLENGNLVRGCACGIGMYSRFMMGGFTGRVEMFNWEGDKIWDYVHSNRQECIHNDIEPMPNGNIMMTVWQYKTRSEAIAAGVNPNFLNPWGGLIVDYIIEVEPTFPKGGNIVWEWHVWDHLIQDFDPTKENYGNVSEHPELIDINAEGRYTDRSRQFPLLSVDLTHINSIDYNEEFDQILLSSAFLNEIFIIDHNTTTQQAAGHTGGGRGKGGDLLYRWGNPQNYHAGNKEDQIFYLQHDARWVEPGYPGEGHITIFNNGVERPDGNYSSIEEIIPPVDADGNYTFVPGYAFGPEETFWNYTGAPQSSFYASKISGAQKLPSGNMVATIGTEGKIMEITPEKEIVWEYTNPFSILMDKLHLSKLYLGLDNVFKVQCYSSDYPGLNKLLEN